MLSGSESQIINHLLTLKRWEYKNKNSDASIYTEMYIKLKSNQYKTLIMSNVATVPSSIQKMNKTELCWSFYRLGLNKTMTKEEMYAKIKPVLTPEVIDRVKRKEEY